MQELLAVALGGSIGAVSRYLVTNYIFIRWHCHWPWATFIVNAAGCLAMGFLMVLITEKGLLTFIIVRWFSGRIDNIFFI